MDQCAYVADGDSGMCVLDVSELEASLPSFCPRKDYVMIGIPVIVNDGDAQQLFRDNFNDTSPGSPYWRVSRWDAATARYIRYCEDDPGGDAGDPADFAPGLGFWVSQWPVENCEIDIREAQMANEVPQDQRFRVALERPQNGNRGLNMMANPFNYTYDWRTTCFDDNNTVLTIAEAASANWISGFAYVWDYEEARYVTVNYHPDSTSNYTIDPWQGFWVEQIDPNRDLDILFTPKGYEPPGGMPPRAGSLSSIGDEQDWSFALQVMTADGTCRDMRNKLGIYPQADDGYDCFDAMEFNPMSSEYVQLYFDHPDWKIGAKKYTYDYRSSEFTGPKTWDFVVRTWNLPENDLVLKWSNVDRISNDYSFILEDLDLDVVVGDIRTIESYDFRSGRRDLGERKFRLRVTSSRPSTIVDDFRLTAVYPNPFNVQLAICFDIPDLMEIDLKVFDRLGREVATVATGKFGQGRHQISWEAAGCASGVYYLRLTTNDRKSLKKIVLMK